MYVYCGAFGFWILDFLDLEIHLRLLHLLHRLLFPYPLRDSALSTTFSSQCSTLIFLDAAPRVCLIRGRIAGVLKRCLREGEQTATWNRCAASAVRVDKRKQLWVRPDSSPCLPAAQMMNYSCRPYHTTTQKYMVITCPTQTRTF